MPLAYLDIGLQALPALFQSSGPPVGKAFRWEVRHFVQFLDLPGGYRGAITVSQQSPSSPLDPSPRTLLHALPWDRPW